MEELPDKSDLEFAERMRIAVERAGGPALLAARSGVSLRQIHKYRQGTADPSRQRMISLAQAAGVRPGWLATGEPPMMSDEWVPDDPWLWVGYVAEGDRKAVEYVRRHPHKYLEMMQNWLMEKLDIGALFGNKDAAITAISNDPVAATQRIVPDFVEDAERFLREEGPPIPSTLPEPPPLPTDRAKSLGLTQFCNADELGDGYILLPRYEVRAAAGAGALVHSEQIVDYLAFRADWVRNRLRRNPETLILIEAMGDSMENTIANGDLLLIDTGEQKVRDSAIYALSIDGVLVVKRVRRELGRRGGLTIISDNPRYGEQYLEPGEADLIRVVGQVVWHGGVL